MVRQLRVKLTPDQRDLLNEYVQLNLGKRSVTTTASVQMTGGLVSPRGDERLRCSEFVALMLHLLGLAEPDMPASFTYLATAGSGQLLHPPRDVEMLLEQSLSPEASAQLSPTRHRQMHRVISLDRQESQGGTPVAHQWQGSRMLPVEVLAQ